METEWAVYAYFMVYKRQNSIDGGRDASVFAYVTFCVC